MYQVKLIFYYFNILIIFIGINFYLGGLGEIHDRRFRHIPPQVRIFVVYDGTVFVLTFNKYAVMKFESSENILGN